MAFQVVGRSGITKTFNAAASPGTTISLVVPVKSFIIKPVGGSIQFKFDTNETDGNAFLIGDGEALQFDLSLSYPYSTNTSIIGYAIGDPGVTIYVAAAY